MQEHSELIVSSVEGDVDNVIGLPVTRLLEEHFPKLVEVFVEKVKELFSIKEAQERKEREDRAAARKEQYKHRRGRNDWER